MSLIRSFAGINTLGPGSVSGPGQDIASYKSPLRFSLFHLWPSLHHNLFRPNPPTCQFTSMVYNLEFTGTHKHFAGICTDASSPITSRVPPKPHRASQPRSSGMMHCIIANCPNMVPQCRTGREALAQTLDRKFRLWAPSCIQSIGLGCEFI